MIIFRPCFIPLFFLLTFAVALQSCDDSDRPGTWTNEQIKPNKKDDFHQLNEQLFTDLKDDKPKQLEDLLSKELLDNGYYKNQVEMYNSRCKLGYTILGEYNIIRAHPGDYKISTSTVDGEKIDIKYQSPTREVYIAFLVPKTSDEDKWMLTAMYCKYDYGWKLNKLSMDRYTQAGKTAPQLFERAKQQYKKAYLVNALNAMEMANMCIRPSGLLEYPATAEMYSYYAKILNEATLKYKLPLILTQVPTKPQIIRIFNQSSVYGIVPTIYYISKVKLKDTVAIRKENNTIKKVIGQVIQGIDKDKKYLLFSALNKWPSANKSVDSYDMMVKLQ